MARQKSQARAGRDIWQPSFTADFWIWLKDYEQVVWFLLSRTQAGPGRTVKQEQEEISPNHVRINLISVFSLKEGCFTCGKWWYVSSLKMFGLDPQHPKEKCLPVWDVDGLTPFSVFPVSHEVLSKDPMLHSPILFRQRSRLHCYW